MRIRSVLTAGLAAAALVLTGCGSEVAGSGAAGNGTTAATSAPTSIPEIGEPSEPELPSSPAPVETSTAPVEPSEEPGEEPAGENIDIAEFAAKMTESNAEVSSAKGTMTMDLAGSSMEVAYEMAAENNVPTAMKMSMSVGGAAAIDMEILFVDGKFYLGGDQFLSMLGVSGGTWVELDENSSNPTIAQMAKQMQSSVEMQGPAQAAALVKSAKSVEYIGVETVDGVDLEHYRLVVDGQAALESGGSMGSAGGAGSSGMGDVPMDMWLDNEGRTVQMTMTIEAAGQSVTMDMKMFDYNEPVDISAPAAADIATVPGG